MTEIVSADDLVVDTSQLVLSAGHLLPPVVEGQGQITLNNCKDVHIGHKYENNGDVIIQQNISMVSESLTDRHCQQFALEPNDSSIHHKLSGEIRDWISNNRCASLMVVTIVILFIATIWFLIVKLKVNNISNLENFKEASINSEELEREYPRTLKFVWRDAWGAAQPTASQDNNSLPVERIIMCHSASQGTCNKFSACKQRVLSFQELHMDADHDYGDIGYNFVIGGDGYIYVGRGWDTVGAHSRGYNYNSLGVAFVGDFTVDEPNDNMVTATETLVTFGVKLGKISKDYQVYGHCQVMAMFPVSPGRNVMKFIRTWSHWNDTNISQCKG